MLTFIQNISSGLSNIFSNDFTAGITVSNIFGSLISRMPDGGTLPDGVHEAAIYFGNTLAKVNFILPVDVLIACLAVILSLKITLFGFHVALWIANFIRGIATAPYDGTMLPDNSYSNGGWSHRR